MPQPPNGWIEDPKNPGWWYDPNGDVTNESNWWQAVPAGWVQDNDPAWYYNPAGDVTKPENWWTNGRVQPAKVVEWYEPVLQRARFLYGKTPYVFGGDRQPGVNDVTKPNGWDCIGYVMECLDAHNPPLGGFKLGVHQGYINAERARQACAPVPQGQEKVGDLIFFQNTYPTTGASHVGIVLDPKRSLMADDHDRKNGTGPGETNYSEPYWRSKFMEFRRVPR